MYTVELFDIFMALEWIEQYRPNKVLVYRGIRGIVISIGIRGNEKVHKLAKQALRKGNICIKLSKPEGKGNVWRKKNINREWQQHWDQETGDRHLHSIQYKAVKDTGKETGEKRS